MSKLVQSVAPKFPRLQLCRLKRCIYLNDAAIQIASQNWPGLKTLELSDGVRLTDAALFALANGCPMLEKLDLSGCRGITEAGLLAIVHKCNNLRHLNLWGCNDAGTDRVLQVPHILLNSFCFTTLHLAATYSIPNDNNVCIHVFQSSSFNNTYVEHPLCSKPTQNAFKSVVINNLKYPSHLINIVTIYNFNAATRSELENCVMSVGAGTALQSAAVAQLGVVRASHRQRNLSVYTGMRRLARHRLMSLQSHYR